MQVSEGRIVTSLIYFRLQDRFYSYEGLERHLVLAHGLVTGDLLAKAKMRQDAGRCQQCSRVRAKVLIRLFYILLSALCADVRVQLPLAPGAGTPSEVVFC